MFLLPDQVLISCHALVQVARMGTLALEVSVHYYASIVVTEQLEWLLLIDTKID